VRLLTGCRLPRPHLGRSTMSPSELARFSVPSIYFHISRPSCPNVEDETTAGMRSFSSTLGSNRQRGHSSYNRHKCASRGSASIRSSSSKAS
jgi:hypothetical protein